jgi:branched-chain amino acid transport system ATP-binding protein
MGDAAQPGAPLLEVEGLDAFYGQAQVLTAVSLAVPERGVVALLGRNGAGKSTTLKSIMGMVARRAQALRFSGHDLMRLEPYRIALAGVGYVPEDRRIFTDLTVAENLEVGRQPPRDGAPDWTPAKLFELFPNLAEMQDRSAAHMSGGEQQMLAIARTLMGNPRLLLLDEPSEGLAPRIVELMAKAILALKQEGLAILLCEQNFHFASYVCDRAVVLETGAVRFAGTMSELRSNEEARQAYLAV